MTLADDAKTCIDRDECAEWGYCEQKCKNTKGSFECSCSPGYELRGNTSCRAKANTHSLRLYFVYTNRIVFSDRSGTNVKELFNVSEASGIDFKVRNDSLYYTDVESRKVYRVHLDSNGQNAKDPFPFSATGAWSPVAVAIDWIGGNVYVVDALGQKIDVFDEENVYHAIVLGSNLTAPSDIALDPTVGFMFIADNNRVVRANMDGSNVKNLVSDTVYKASGVAVDIINKRVFWSDVHLDYIETVDYEGNDRQTVIRSNQHLPGPSRIAVFENRVFWTDSTKQVRLGKLETSKLDPHLFRFSYFIGRVQHR